MRGKPKKVDRRTLAKEVRLARASISSKEGSETKDDFVILRFLSIVGEDIALAITKSQACDLAVGLKELLEAAAAPNN